ncbi:hypothetical protein CQA53_00190 [Helicobacter didelphidarum]|uniref:Major outer membrane protein n=1 Tax=Helicobacter didelphidarum TaxID=2040648 RepID=A0A3D8IQC2_9HELI|nr:hypothetical protein [Helicobacter didelphidarum]RDU67487.1 hypothetical protein CQA53_00190 [Helicobacter didelphidarum]
MKKSILTLRTSLLSALIVGSSAMNLEAAKLMDVIQNATISGFAFGRIQTIHGRDGNGTRYQLRFKPTITTGEVYGWSGSAGIFFSKGSGTPDSNNTNADISGSRGDMHISLVDRFSIGDFYITYQAKEQLGTNTLIRAGQKSPTTPYNDTNLDRALGIFLENSDLSALNIGFQWWDTWIGDDMFISPNLTGSNYSNSSTGIGNDVFMLSLTSGKDFTEKTGFGYQVWYSYVEGLFDYMTFADISYTAKFGSQSLGILAQVSATGLNKKPTFLSNGSLEFNTLFQNTNYDYARNRGMYNIRLDYRYNFTQSQSAATEDSDAPAPAPTNVGFIGVAVGFAGSFGDGYGTLIDNTGGLKIGGNIWNNFAGTEANGFGILGTGSFRNSSITAPYLKVEFGYKKFGLALDVVYVDTTHFYYLKKAGATGNLNGATGNLYGPNNKIAVANFVETSLSATYKFTDSINMGAYYGYLIGNPSMGRFRFQVNYVF